jgi:hypothetical protein
VSCSVWRERGWMCANDSIIAMRINWDGELQPLPRGGM